MLLACAALIGRLCVPAAYIDIAHYESMVTDNRPRAYSAEMARRRRIDIMFFSGDSFEQQLSVTLNRTCHKGLCVYYRRHCTAAGTTCEWEVSDTTPERPAQDVTLVHESIVIKARSHSAMRTLLGQVRFVLKIEAGRMTESLPLSALGIESVDVHPSVGCERTVWVQGCPRPGARRWQRPAPA